MTIIEEGSSKKGGGATKKGGGVSMKGGVSITTKTMVLGGVAMKGGGSKKKGGVVVNHQKRTCFGEEECQELMMDKDLLQGKVVLMF